jgi:hypothetical protein
LLTLCSVAIKAADRRLFGSSLSQQEIFELLPFLDDLDVGDAPLFREAGETLHPALPRVQAWLGSIGIDLPYLVASISLVGVAGFNWLGMIWRTGMIGLMFWQWCRRRDAHARSLPLHTHLLLSS